MTPAPDEDVQTESEVDIKPEPELESEPQSNNDAAEPLVVDASDVDFDNMTEDDRACSLLLRLPS